MTPFELSMYSKSFIQKNKMRSDEELILAYLNAAWQRAKRMPDLKKMLHSEDRPKQKQTPESMLDEIKKLNAALGGGVT